MFLVSIFDALTSGVLLAVIACGLSLWSVEVQSTVSWVERARLAYPARRILALNQLILPWGTASLLDFAGHGTLDVLTAWAFVYAVTLLSSWLLEYYLLGWSLATFLRSYITLLITMGYSPILIGLLLLMMTPATIGWEVGLAAIVVLFWTVFCEFGGGLWVLLKMGLASEEGGYYRLHVASANTFAHPLGKWVAVTDGAFAVLNEEEAQVVLAHEKEHLSMGLIYALMRSAIGPFAFLILLSGKFPGQVPTLSLLCGLTPLVGPRVMGKLAVAEQERADRASMLGEMRQGVYIRALEKMYCVNLQAVFDGSQQGYPTLYDRMENAGIRPNFPNPKPPPKLLFSGVLVLECAVLLYLLFSS